MERGSADSIIVLRHVSLLHRIQKIHINFLVIHCVCVIYILGEAAIDCVDLSDHIYLDFSSYLHAIVYLSGFRPR